MFNLKHKTKTLTELKASRTEIVNVNDVIQDKLTFSDKLAIRITGWVGSMNCAYIFSIIAFISLPDAIKGGVATTISWIAQTFLQLVLLSIIMVGQKVESAHSEERANADFEINKKAEIEIETILQHLENQNEMMLKILQQMNTPQLSVPESPPSA